ncbi:hypothetical protein DRQ05_02635 [bacterium]|nr:MAG: hypothetical protein DRQ05_02635 [bacterium]
MMERKTMMLSARSRLVLFALLTAALAAYIGCSKKPEKLKLPSQISAQVWDSLRPLLARGEIAGRDAFYEAQRRYTAMLIDSMQTNGLSMEEQVQCAKELATAGKVDRATELLTPLLEGKDKYAREALKTLVSIKIIAKDAAGAENLMADYRRRFQPNSNDTDGLYNQISDLGDLLNSEGRADESIRVIEDEINSLRFDAPYSSFYFVDELFPLMVESGRLEELASMVANFDRRLSQSYKAYEDTVSYADSTAEANDETARQYRFLLKTFKMVGNRIKLIGKKAPEIRFAHVYNADSTTTFDRLRGRVTVLDFWATWCLPCIIGFNELGELYDQYKDRGLEIVSITSFQGMYIDREAGISEGSRDKKISKAREIELTASFTKKHNMRWPVAFSDRSVFDERYGITGIPTYVVLDHDGIIRYIQVGIGKKAQMKRILEKLL